MQPFTPKMIESPYVFFTGKGGVGKTSSASATAIALAVDGKKVLLVSTDPASNLDDLFHLQIKDKPTPILAVPGLEAINLDPEQAADVYKESVVSPYRGLLPDSAIQQMEEQLSGACTVEIAAFNEFTRLLTDPAIRESYDHILFDTAPTGHTLRLLQLPTAWTGYLNENQKGASCLGPLSGLDDKKELYANSLDTLSDSADTQMILVTRPETSALTEANRASGELSELGIQNQQLLINGYKMDFISDDEVSEAFYRRQQEALGQMPGTLKQIAHSTLPYVAYSLDDVPNLRHLFSEDQTIEIASNTGQEYQSDPRLSEVVEDLSNSGKRLIFTMGKGGVGKTTIASTIAVGLVEKGYKVHLTTTDPAAHLDEIFEKDKGSSNLTISRIDPVVEVEAYKNKVIHQSEQNLSKEELDFLKEDLNSPCTEEIAVFEAFADMVAKADDEVVIIDTAPTGHTLLLLEATETYNRDIERTTGDVSDNVKNLLPRLRNPEETGVLIVSLAEATPVLESERLQKDLQRASIQPSWWVFNQCLSTTNTLDPVLQDRAKAEYEWLEYGRSISKNVSLVSWNGAEIAGYQRLKALL